MRFFDTHCHLNLPPMSAGVSGILNAAEAVGVERFLIPGTDAASSASAARLGDADPRIRWAAGMHPLEAGGDPVEIARLAGLRGCVAVGEVGLDYSRLSDLPDGDASEAAKQHQQGRFIAMIAIARERALPLVVHTREAHSDTRALLRDFAAGIPTVIHCFAGTEEDVGGYLELGCHISFTGMVTYRKNEALRLAAAAVPADRLMLETDSPYLSPQGFRTESCEPKHLPVTAGVLAEVRGTTVEVLAGDAWITSGTFFRWE